MINNKFKYQSRIDRFQFDYALNWYFRVRDEKNFKKDVTDTFLEVFKCDSYFQQALLENAIDHIFATQERLCILDIIIELKKMLLREKVEEEAVGNTDNIGRLLTRLRPYETIENFYIKRGVTDRENSGQVVIMDISNFPEKQRKFLTELFLKLLWKESYRQEYENHCDAVILDEMQFLSIKEDDILTAFLREGRKKGFELVMGTQFIYNYTKVELQILQQASNFVIFHPTPEDCRFSAKIIDTEDFKVWEKKLLNLAKGEAILKGRYKIGQSQKITTTPIIVKI